MLLSHGAENPFVLSPIGVKLCIKNAFLVPAAFHDRFEGGFKKGGNWDDFRVREVGMDDRVIGGFLYHEWRHSKPLCLTGCFACVLVC